ITSQVKASHAVHTIPAKDAGFRNRGNRSLAGRGRKLACTESEVPVRVGPPLPGPGLLLRTCLSVAPKFPEGPLEMINGLIVFEGSPQEVAFKGDDTSATAARQCIICLDP